jgi:hypothetical protein
MTTARINVLDRFDEMTLELERRTVVALDAAAAEAAAVAEKQANEPKPIAHFSVVPAHNIGTGYASGVKAGPLTHIFDKGSLGKRTAKLKRGSRQADLGSQPRREPLRRPPSRRPRRQGRRAPEHLQRGPQGRQGSADPTAPEPLTKRERTGQ